MDNVFDTILAKLIRDELLLPTLPVSITHIMLELDKLDLEISNVELLVSRDQSIANRIIKYAGTAYLGRGSKVSSLKQAIIRVGLSSIRSTVVAIGIEQLFNSGDNKASYYLNKQWKLNIEIMVAALYLLSVTDKKHTSTKDEILLLALCHSVGMIPVIFELSEHGPITNLNIDPISNEAIRDLSQHITTMWSFDPKYARYISELEGQSTGKLTPPDFILAAYAMVNSDENYAANYSSLFLNDGSILDENHILGRARLAQLF